MFGLKVHYNKNTREPFLFQKRWNSDPEIIMDWPRLVSFLWIKRGRP